MIRQERLAPARIERASERDHCGGDESLADVEPFRALRLHHFLLFRPCRFALLEISGQVLGGRDLRAHDLKRPRHDVGDADKDGAGDEPLHRT